MAVSFNEYIFLQECQLKQNLYLHACFDLLSCASTIVCAAVFENRYGKDLRLIENKPEKKVIPDLLRIYFHCTTAEIVVQVRSKKEYTLWDGD